jgi:hypothetical protein
MDTIPAKALSKILNIDEDELREWERARLIRRAQASGCSRLDAVQCAMVLRLLGRQLDRDDIRRVMDGVRKDLEDTVPAGRLRILCHLQRRTGDLVVGEGDQADAAVGRAASTDRLVVVVDVTEEVTFAIAAFDTELRGRAGKGASKSRRTVADLRGTN